MRDVGAVKPSVPVSAWQAENLPYARRLELAAHVHKELKRASNTGTHQERLEHLDLEDLGTFTVANMQRFTASALAFAVGKSQLRKDDTTKGTAITTAQAIHRIVRRVNPCSLSSLRPESEDVEAQSPAVHRSSVREPCHCCCAAARARKGRF